MASASEGAASAGTSHANRNMERMQTLDDACNAQDMKVSQARRRHAVVGCGSARARE
jgi:hypothetical protein